MLFDSLLCVNPSRRQGWQHYIENDDKFLEDILPDEEMAFLRKRKSLLKLYGDYISGAPVMGCGNDKVRTMCMTLREILNETPTFVFQKTAHSFEVP